MEYFARAGVILLSSWIENGLGTDRRKKFKVGLAYILNKMLHSYERNPP